MSQIHSQRLTFEQPYADQLYQLMANLDCERGSIVDIGGELVAFSELFTRFGFDYVSCPLNNNPSYLTELADALNQLKEISLICFNSLAQLSNTPVVTLTFLAEYARLKNISGLVLILPNLAFQDTVFQFFIGQKLNQEICLSGTTYPELLNLLSQSGWQSAKTYDLVSSEPPANLSSGIVAKSTVVGQVLHQLAAEINPHLNTSYFIRLLQPVLANPTTLIKEELDFSVLIRTNGANLEFLTECLYSIFAQDCQEVNYEVLVSGIFKEEHYQTLLSQLPPEFRTKIRLLTFQNGSVDPRNQLMTEARGKYFILLNEDELLFESSFSSIIGYYADPHHHETVVKGLVAYRSTQPHTPEAIFPYYTTKLKVSVAQEQTTLDRLLGNVGPLSCYVFPRFLAEQTNVRFEVETSDQDFINRVAALFKVISLSEFIVMAKEIPRPATVAKTNINPLKTSQWVWLPQNEAKEFASGVVSDKQRLGELEESSANSSQEYQKNLKEIKKNFEEARSYTVSLEQTISQLQSSLSWRMFEPIRKLIKIIKKYRPGS